MSEYVEGYVRKIVYRNVENGYTVLELESKEDEITCVGNFTFIGEGEFIQVTGNFTAHQLYGEQFSVKSYEIKEPEDVVSMERYLGSGAIKGIGAKLAARIVKRFKKDTFRIIEDEPERLSEIKGISEKIAREIGKQFEEKREMRSAMLFLQQYGITINLGVKIYNQYGVRMYEIIRENPYKLAEDITGVGFKIADEIAAKVGIGADADYRVRAGILFALVQASNNGHVYLPEQDLVNRACEILNVTAETVLRHITALVLEKKLILKENKGERRVYSTVYYHLELGTARMLCDLNVSYEIPDGKLFERIQALECNSDIKLDEMQRMAVIEAARNGLFILTGGPGTGKTTTINAMLHFFEDEGMDILLAAPTGRAAKRMAETTGFEARTIHRMLELSKGTEDREGSNFFERNEKNPLETDVLIVDEMSMVDISLMHSLLRAVTIGTRLILVGDVNQLPSVGPGNVLHDMIASNIFPVVQLTKIFRQASESDIIVNAHKINRGESIRFDNKSKDFFLLQREDVNTITGVMIALIRDKLPKYVQATPFEIQILTPMRKGELGVERLNQVLQQYLNPPSPEKKEKEYHQGIFREGDKIMQIKNNYQLTWEVKSKFGTPIESGTGVFNGDSGIVQEINLFAETMTVLYDEGRVVEYLFTGLEELELAYAVTIHKSQGSEYPAVILPLLSGPKLLFNRNLLYTAVTRAKSCVTIVGSSLTVQEMIDNENEQKRYSGLKECILDCSKDSILMG